MNAEKTPESPLEEDLRTDFEEAQWQDVDTDVTFEDAHAEEIERAAKEQFEEYRAALEEKQSTDLKEERGERGNLKVKIMRQTLLAQEQYYAWRKVLIPLMVAVPGVLFLIVMWIIFFSTPENSGIWTKNIFVSGFFITLVGFYTSLTKGLFGSDKDEDKILTEKANDATKSAAKASDNS